MPYEVTLVVRFERMPSLDQLTELLEADFEGVVIETEWEEI